jgi:hypothetical protein
MTWNCEEILMEMERERQKRELAMKVESMVMERHVERLITEEKARKVEGVERVVEMKRAMESVEREWEMKREMKRERMEVVVMW